MKVKSVRQKDVPITLGGVERVLKFDLNAFAALEEEYGDIDTAMSKMEKGSITTVRAFIWAGLQHEDKPPTIKQVGSMLDLSDLEMLSVSLGEALATSLPEQETDPNEQSQ